MKGVLDCGRFVSGQVNLLVGMEIWEPEYMSIQVTKQVLANDEIVLYAVLWCGTGLLLLLILNKLNVIFWYLLVLLLQKLLNFHADITLHHNFLSSARKLCH